MKTDFDWTLCRTFLAVLRTRSFSGAGRSLNQAPPTVRRQIELLELAVGSVLFSRSTDGVRATPLAERLAPFAEEVELAAANFAVASVRERHAGMVTITAEAMIATLLLPPILAATRRAHPALRFELIAERDGAGWMARTTDLSFGFVRPTSEGLIVSRIATLEVGLYASHGWLDENGWPETIAACVGPGRLVGNPQDLPTIAVIGSSPGPIPADHYALETRDRSAAFAAVTGGAGIGLLPTQIADADARLFRVLPEARSTVDMWMTTHPDLRRSPPVRTTIDAIRKAIT